MARSEASAVLWLTVGVALSLGIGIVVGRLTTTNRGMFIWGAGLLAMAMRFGNSQEFAFGGGSLGAAAIETVIWGIVVLAGTWVMFRVCGGLGDIAPVPGHRGLRWNEALRGAAAALIMLPVVWLLARFDLKGQALGAAVCGAILAGLAGRLAAPKVQPVLLYAAPVFVCALAHAISWMLLTGPIEASPAAGTLPRLAYAMPVDYAAAGIFGVSIGIAWARSFIGPKPA